MALMTETFTVTVLAGRTDEALAKVERHLVEGFATTGRAAVSDERHRLVTVEVANLGGDADDCWVRLTSYGMSPSAELGSCWGELAG